MLLLETGMAGTFIAFDLILFFVFWELVLVPMYFLIGDLGLGATAQYAAIKFFLYTLFGSIFMLLGLPGHVLQRSRRRHTFDIIELPAVRRRRRVHARRSRTWSFGAVALGFAIKVPMWPFHTWLPDAHTEAPTVGSVLLAGDHAEDGDLRLHPDRAADPARCGAETYAPWIGILAVIAIIYAALAASPRPT